MREVNPATALPDVAMKIDNRTLWLFADGMATCLAAGLPPQRALEMSRSGLRSAALTQLTRVAQRRCDQGMSMAEALAPNRKVLPHYFLPVIQAGEAGGRLVEAFQLLQGHCSRIAPTMRLVRNTWLFPLVVILWGWCLRIGVFLYFGKYSAAAHFFEFAFGSSATILLVGWGLLKVREVKLGVDWLQLQIPLLREAELQTAIVLFFATFRLAYEAGGMGVVAMFDLASQTLRNTAIQRDWLKARQVLEQNGTFADAFGQLTLLEDRLKGMIATGSLSGQLDQSLKQLVASVTQRLEFALQAFNNIFQRIVTFCVIMSVVETVLMCVL